MGIGAEELGAEGRGGMAVWSWLEWCGRCACVGSLCSSCVACERY